MSKSKLKTIYKNLGIIENVEEDNKLINLLKIPKKDNKINTPSINTNVEGISHQIDLLFLPHDNHFKYLLVAVDLASHKVDAEPLRNKDSETTKTALLKIYSRDFLKLPKYIEVDDGTEFKGDFKNYFEKLVRIKTKLVGRSRQQAVVEYMNSLISKIIQMNQLANETHSKQSDIKWKKVLPAIIEQINEQFNKPIIKKSVGEPRCSGSSCKLIPVDTKVRVALDKPKDYLTNRKLHGKFRIGDPRWENKIRTVEMSNLKPDQVPLYQISGIKGAMYTKNQLQIVKDDEKNTLNREDKIPQPKKKLVSKKVIDSNPYKKSYANSKKR